ncbi:MAG: hypothetical protein J6Q38_01330 [Clostridia bacterium]|nr:hypothetical protein [Clostridia bacterium]
MKENLYRLFLKTISIPYVQVGKSYNYQVEVNDSKLTVYFEDSNGKTDWKNNLDFPVKAHKRKNDVTWLVHRGFLNEWQALEPILSFYLLNKNIKEITISGYSHGAAIALLCHEYAYYYRPDLRDKLFGYGFGCPRVYWGLKRNEILKRFKNFTVIRNVNDIVTRLPPIFLGYSHVGRVLEIGERGKYSDVEAHFSDNILKELKIYEEKTR